MSDEYAGYQAGEDFAGLENLVQTVPRLNLAQSNTEELKSDSDSFLPGLVRGHFFTTKGRTVLGNKTVIRVFAFREVWIEWNGTEFVAAHRARSVNIVNESEFGKWQNEAGNKISPTIEMAVQVVDHEDEGMLVLSFKGKSFKTGRNILRILSSLRDDGVLRPIWASELEITSSKQANESGDFYVIGDGSAKSGGKLVRDEKGNIKKLSKDGFAKFVSPVLALAQTFRNALPAPEDVQRNVGPVEDDDLASTV